MQRSDGKQLLGEAVYLLGVILLSLDHKLPGIIRLELVLKKIMIVSYIWLWTGRIYDVQPISG